MENAVDAVTDAQFIFRRFEMNVGRPVLEGFPNDLVDELDDAGVLIIAGDLTPAVDLQLDRVVFFGHFVERLGTDAVVLLQRLFDFGTGGQSVPNSPADIELNTRQHGRVEGIGHSHHQHPSLIQKRNDRELESHLGADALANFRSDTELGQIDKLEGQGRGQLLKKGLFSQTSLPREKRQPGLGSATLDRSPPRIRPPITLGRRQKACLVQNGFQWRVRHAKRPSCNSDRQEKLREKFQSNAAKAPLDRPPLTVPADTETEERLRGNAFPEFFLRF